VALAIGGPVDGRNIIAWSRWVAFPVYDLETRKPERHIYEHIGDVLFYAGVLEEVER
jgi:hypothetical protein